MKDRFHLFLLAALLLQAPGSIVAQVHDTTLPDAPSAPITPASAKGFFGRWARFYRDDWKGAAASGPAPARRGLPQPLSSPPFPSADWSYGGSPVIGEPDTNSYPLMAALFPKDGGASQRTKIYGWIAPTVNLSTSRDRNTPVANDLYSNRLQLNQAVLYLERLPDSVQRDHIDWGYHLTAFYGTDYRYTTDKGYFSQQLIARDQQYGFDPVLEYIDIYFPHIAKGMNLRAGRFISIPGIEAQLTPNNYASSHSLLYSIDPFTDTGLLATIQLSDQWLIQAGLHASHDVALWTPDAKPSFTGCLSYTTKSVNDNVYLCANGINDGEYAYNNLQMYDGTWYHKFNSTWHMATEIYAMYQRDVPSTTQTALIEKGTNGAFCKPGQIRCLAPEWAAVNYINKQLGPHNFVSLRSDYLNDKKGQRTGYAGKYTENTLMLSHWIGSTVQIRPEIRFDHAWDNTAYDKGTRRNQFMVATDLIVHF